MKTLWIFSAVCKAAWLIRNALSNTGTYTGIKSHSKTDSDTENRRTRRGKAAVLATVGASPPLPPLPLGRQLHRPFLFAVCSVGADLHQRPSEAGPFVVVRNSQLGAKRQGIRSRGAGGPAAPLAQNRSPTPEQRSCRCQGGCARWSTKACTSPTPRGQLLLQLLSDAKFPGQTSQVPTQVGRSFYSLWQWKKKVWFYLTYLTLRQSVLPECCCKVYPLVKIFQIFQTKVRPWSLQISTCMFNCTCWPFAAQV